LNYYFEEVMGRFMDLVVLMPFFNEEKQIPITIDRMIPLLNNLKIRYSLLLVDDGSKDGTWDAISNGVKKHPKHIRGLRLSRNFGKEAAICAGLDVADADAVILMDGDLQHPPEMIPEMIRLWRQEGFEIVEGVKSSRGKESLTSRINASLFYGIFHKVSGYQLANASDFKLLDRKVVLKWREFTEHNTFFRGLSAWLGFRRVTFPFEIAERQTGVSRWSFGRLIGLSIDAITSFSAMPLHLITTIGVAFLVGALILMIQTLINYFGGHAASGFTTVIVVELSIGACIMISLGLIGTYIARIFEEVKNRPRYIVSEDTMNK
jgi:glycosyltransferase involved in cell wall biosynthesis